MKLQLSLILCMVCFYSVFGQRFSTPAPGKANVCVALVDGSFKNQKSGIAYHVQVYEDNRYIEKLDYTEYVIYESDTGSRIFWLATPEFYGAVSNQYELFFLEANLKEGKTYILIPKVKFFDYDVFTLNRYSLEPLSLSDTINYTRTERLFRHIDPKVTSQKKLEKINARKKRFMDAKLKDYRELKEENNEEQIGILDPEQYIPVEDLKW